jgi:hypothetical protein
VPRNLTRIPLASQWELLNIAFNMKNVSVRQIVHGFSKLHKSLKPGQSVDITNRGQAIGQYIKRPARRIKMPNFYKACQLGYGPKLGDDLLRRILADDEAISSCRIPPGLAD